MFSTEQGASPDTLTKVSTKPVNIEGNIEVAGSLSALASGTDENPIRELGKGSSRLQELRNLSKTKSLVKRSSDELRALWKKAGKAVVCKIRIRKLGLGLSNTRIKKSQSLFDRLERMETQLFELPITLMDTFERGLLDSEYVMAQELKKLDRNIEESRRESLDAITNVGNTLGEVQKDLAELDTSLSDLSNLVEERTASQAQQVDLINDLNIKISESESGNAMSIRKKMRALMDQLSKLSKSFELVDEGIYTMMAKESIAHESRSDDAITVMMKLDTQLRHSRQSISTVEGNCFVLSKLVGDLKEEILAARHGVKANISEDDRNDLIGACNHISNKIFDITVRTRDAQNFCKKHDDELAQRWIAFSGVIQAAKSTTSLASKIKSMQAELDDKPSLAGLLQTVKEHQADTGPLKTEVQELKELLKSQSEEMKLMQSKLFELTDTIDAAKIAMSEKQQDLNKNDVLPPIGRPSSGTNGQTKIVS